MTPPASAIEGSGMGDSYKINQRHVRFTRDPVIVCGPNRRFRPNTSADCATASSTWATSLGMHSSPGFPTSLQTDDQPLKVILREVLRTFLVR